MNIRALRAEETRESVAAQMEEAFARGILFETVHRRRDGTTLPGGDRLARRADRARADAAQHRARPDGARRDAGQPPPRRPAGRRGHARRRGGPRDQQPARLRHGQPRHAGAPPARGDPRSSRAEAAQPPDADSAPVACGARRRARRGREMLAVACEGTARVRTIVLDLKRFSRQDEALVGPVDVHEVLEYALGIAASELRRRARVVRDYGAGAVRHRRRVAPRPGLPEPPGQRGPGHPRGSRPGPTRSAGAHAGSTARGAWSSRSPTPAWASPRA